MLTPPAGLTEDALEEALRRERGLPVASLGYRAVGFGSHHWEVVDDGGNRWFVTVDQDADLGRLTASLSVAVDLHAIGRTFAVAPVPTRTGAPLFVLENFAVTVYPFVDGQSFDWNAFRGPDHRQATLDMIIQLHTAPAIVHRHARVDDFAVPGRGEIEAALKAPGPDCGPYARLAAELLAGHREALAGLLARYDELVLDSHGEPVRAVLTHGEPHSGNTMLTPSGWRLIDWDTVLVSPPERDLWLIEPGDGSIFSAYAAATGVLPRPSTIMLYQLRWALTGHRRRGAPLPPPAHRHADDLEGWEILRSVVTRI